MPYIQTWDGIINGEQINPPEYRWTDGNPADEYNLPVDVDPAETTAASFQKTALEIAWEIADLEETAERKAAHDRAVRLAMVENEKTSRRYRRK